MSMIERVARAMCNDLGVNPDAWHEDDGVRVYAWQKEASTARAAIEAMRELTLKQRYIGGDKLRALAKELRALRPTFAQNGQEKGWVSAPAKDLERAEAIDALLSELEAVKGENRRLQTEVLNAAFSDRLDMEAGGSPLTWKEIALSAEAALASLKEERGSSGGRVQAAPDGATEGQRSAGYKGVRLYTRRIEGGAGAHVIVEMERADGTSVEAIREYADISDSIIDHWARLPRPEEGK